MKYTKICWFATWKQAVPQNKETITITISCRIVWESAYFTVTPKEKKVLIWSWLRKKKYLSYYLEENGKGIIGFISPSAVMKYNFSTPGYLVNRLFFITTEK